MNLVAFTLSELDKWHQWGILVFADDDLSGTTCSINIMRHLYVFNLCCTFRMSCYPSLRELPLFCSAYFLLPSCRKLLIRLPCLSLITLISFKTNADTIYQSCSYLLSHKMLKTSCKKSVIISNVQMKANGTRCN